MPNREQRIVTRLQSIATTSDMYNRHSAGIVKGGKILATGINSTRACFGGNAITSLHAEVAAIYSAIRKGITPQGDIWVIQYKRSGVLGKSKPCESCLNTIKQFKISRIFYSTDIGIETVKVWDAVSDWKSGAQKVYGNNRIIFAV